MIPDHGIFLPPSNANLRTLNDNGVVCSKRIPQQNYLTQTKHDEVKTSYLLKCVIIRWWYIRNESPTSLSDRCIQQNVALGRLPLRVAL